MYKGCTKDLLNRIKQHNQGKSKYTASKRPWEIVYFEKIINKMCSNKKRGCLLCSLFLILNVKSYVYSQKLVLILICFS
ncbi:MAG: GIY-YIG nuclease family protein [Bacteroidales bacterium]